MNPRCPDCRRHDLACLVHADPLAETTVRCVDCGRRHATIGDRCERCHHDHLAADRDRFHRPASTPRIIDAAVIPEPQPRRLEDLPAQVLADLASARRRLERRRAELRGGRV